MRESMAENGESKEISYEEKLTWVTEIAKPIATKSMAKKIYKVVKKANKDKKLISGLKNVLKSIRKGQNGIMIIAGDVTPIDIICHLPAVCEDICMPYCYVPSKLDLGAALGGSSERACIVAMITEGSEYKDAYSELKEQIKYLPSPV